MDTQTAMQEIGVPSDKQTLSDEIEIEDDVVDAEVELDEFDDFDGDDDEVSVVEDEEASVVEDEEDDSDDAELKPRVKSVIFDDDGVEITLGLDDADAEEDDDDDEVSLSEKREVTSADPFAHYLADLGRYKLLTKEEEHMYGTRIQTAIEEGRVDKHAREMLTNSNLRLVVSIARRYIGAGGNIGMADLVAWGNFGLLEAVEKFKPEYGYRFSTYATWWIKQSIQRKIADVRHTIRKPVHMFQLEHRYRKLMNSLEPGQVMSDDEIAETIKCTLDQLGKVREAMMVNASVSLDMPAAGRDGEDMGAMIESVEDENGERAYTRFESKEMVDAVERLLIRLPDRDATILRFRFGINCNEHTLEETGKHFGITRERVRQIESIALKKLRRYISMDDRDVMALIT